MKLDYSPVASDEDQARLRDILSKSFGGKPELWEERFFNLIGRESLRIAREADGRIVGGLGIYSMGQIYGGRSLPMAGIAGVGVSAEERRKGYARALMEATLRELHRDGVLLSTLYASTQGLYRSVGYEVAGAAYRWSIPFHRIGLREREPEVTEVDPNDYARFEPLYLEAARAATGHADRSRAIWIRMSRANDGERVSAFVVGPEDRPDGYLVWAQTRQANGLGLKLRDFVVRTPAAARRLWSLIGSNTTLGATVSWHGPAHDARMLHLPEADDVKIEDPMHWMLRVVDVPRALAQRGYPDHVSTELHLEVEDELLPANSGRFLLTVQRGEARVEPGGKGELRCDVRGLAPLYSGLYTPEQLAAAGKLEASDAALAAASLLFAGPQPWMPDRF